MAQGSWIFGFAMVHSAFFGVFEIIVFLTGRYINVLNLLLSTEAALEYLASEPSRTWVLMLFYSIGTVNVFGYWLLYRDGPDMQPMWLFPLGQAKIVFSLTMIYTCLRAPGKYLKLPALFAFGIDLPMGIFFLYSWYKVGFILTAKMEKRNSVIDQDAKV